MAQTIFHFIGTPPPLLPPSNSKLRRNHVFQCQCFSNTSSNSNNNGNAPNSRRKSSNSETETPPILKATVSAVTELLRLFSPSNRTSTLSEDTEEFRDEFPLSSVDDVLNIIQSDYDKAYFVTGNFTYSIYAENCIFEDPTIKFRVGLHQQLDQSTKDITMMHPYRPNTTQHGFKDVIASWSCWDATLFYVGSRTPNNPPHFSGLGTGYDVDSETNFVLATWKLRTNLNLPWRPLISIDGSTYYELDEDFKIVRHVESWNVSALEAILQIFTLTSVNTGV